MPNQYDAKDIYGDGSLIIYTRRPRQAGKKPPAWWARCKVKHGVKAIDDSTGFTGFADAENEGKKRLTEYKRRYELGYPLKAKSVDDVIDAFIKRRTQDFEKGEIGKDHHRTTLYSANVLRHIFKYCKSFEETGRWCHKPIEDYCAKNVKNAVQYKNGRRIEFQHKFHFKQIWQFAVDERFVDTSLMPTDGQIRFPDRKAEKIESFSDDELEHIVRYLKDFPSHRPGLRLCYNHDYFWPLVSYYAYLLIYSGMRPAEARRLQWKDIYFVRQGDVGFEANLFSDDNLDNSVVYIRLPSSKAKTKIARQILCRTEYTDILLEHFKWATYDKPDDYLFAKQDDGAPIQRFEASFRRLMEYMAKRYKEDTGKSGVTHDLHGGQRNQYTFRHSYINMRIDDGMDVFDLAQNCGHSVDTMQKFYNDRDDRVNRLHNRQMALAGKRPITSKPEEKVNDLEKRLIESEYERGVLKVRLQEMERRLTERE